MKKMLTISGVFSKQLKNIMDDVRTVIIEQVRIANQKKGTSGKLLPLSDGPSWPSGFDSGKLDVVVSTAENACIVNCEGNFSILQYKDCHPDILIQILEAIEKAIVDNEFEMEGLPEELED